MRDLSTAEIVADYQGVLNRRGEIVEIGRQIGTSPNTNFRVPCRARVKGYRPDQLVGSAIQGEVTIIALLKDLIDGRFPLPVRTSDHVMIRGSQTQIHSVDNNTGRNGPDQVFVKITAKG